MCVKYFNIDKKKRRRINKERRKKERLQRTVYYTKQHRCQCFFFFFNFKINMINLPIISKAVQIMQNGLFDFFRVYLHVFSRDEFNQTNNQLFDLFVNLKNLQIIV